MIFNTLGDFGYISSHIDGRSTIDISYEIIQQALLQTKGVSGAFDLHIWSITSGPHALSAHIVVMDTSNSYQVPHDINSLLEKRFKITHSTIQIEKFHPTEIDE